MVTSSRHEPHPSPTHLMGRLTPMAIDNASARMDGLLLSVPVGGLSQAQIDAVPFGIAGPFRWLGRAIRLGSFPRRRG